jgi:hypothetical protein
MTANLHAASRDEFPKAPDLQKLVERHGGYDKITPEAWRRFDADMTGWQRARRIYTAGRVNEPTNTEPARRRAR